MKTRTNSTFSLFFFLPTENILRQARGRLKTARAATQEALVRYNSLLEQQRTLEAEIIREEVRCEELRKLQVTPYLKNFINRLNS